MASLSAEDVSALVQAATDAAKAASDAVTALREAQATRASGSGFQEASKVVRQPEPFGSENHEVATQRADVTLFLPTLKRS